MFGRYRYDLEIQSQRHALVIGVVRAAFQSLPIIVVRAAFMQIR